MAMGTCFGSKEEQIYMLELLVDHMTLNSDKLTEVGTTPLSVRLKFIDFPIFEIAQDDFAASKRKSEKVPTVNIQPKNDDEAIDFNTGKSCLFSKQPRELVQLMQTRPMKVSIHKVVTKKICDPEEEEVPVCGTQVPLSGCLCDQVAMAMNDIDRLPKPYTIKNTYNMVDVRGKPSGTIAIFLKLSCYGKSIATHFAVRDKLLLFKTPESMKEFQCTRVLPTEEELTERKKIAEHNICVPDEYKVAVTKPTPKVETIMSLIPVCEKLIEKDQCSKNITVTNPHQADIKGGLVPNTTTFGKLLLKDDNKGDFLDLADQTDPSCVCKPGGTFMRSFTGDFPCTGANCAGGLCIGTRLLDPFPRNYHGGTETTPCYTGSCCSGSIQSGGSGCCSKRRLRGGGEEKSGNVCGLDQSQTKKSTDKAKTCKICTQKPCKGVDCLIRAFKETQEFVDSIGKVPGMAGLGLMDPSESPYFGRERDHKQNICTSVKNLCDSAPQHQNHLTSSSPLSQSSPITTKSSVKQNNSHTITGSIPVSGHTVAPTGLLVNSRSGREVQAHLTDHAHLTSMKTKKKEEKIERHKEQEMSLHMQVEFEKGPCGEVKCKSRRKKRAQDDIGSDQSAPGLSLPKKPLPSLKLQNTLPLKPSKHGRSYKNKHHNPKHRIHYPGLIGDHSRTTSSYVKVSKRVMKAVKAARKLLPGIHYGHKNCVDMRMRVPANMGWLWNSFDTPGRLKPRLGWRPGAISKYLYNLMMKAKAGSEPTSESRPATPTKSKKTKATKSRSFQSIGRNHRIKKKEGENDEIEFPPTLHVHRKDGTYYVTMYPINSENAEDSTVQKPVKPLQFKITKNKDDASVCSSSSASDMEIEFSPPAAVSRYRKKPDQVHIDTQVKQQEILDALKPASSPKQNKAKKGDKTVKGMDNTEKKGKGKK
ncbi:uncharacterized protein LOC107263618 [Cephus cinctus]|uniref:Uncharacterized protein LOC107263618 n=1 Tax=Cephus cinctus TaxID=211228 RepID=A0AAJ7BHV6_CEPCN|nr:uncharacterized protein LOC107263618 [Cephus cinctus]